MNNAAAMKPGRDFELEFARAYGEPLLTGRLRATASDFVVREDLGFEPCGDGEHTYLYVRKTGANTAWVAAQLARFAGVRDFDVNYAGKKDRHAVTEQWFSCWLPGKPDPDWQAHGIEGVLVLNAVRHNKKLRRGSHRANYFEITLRLDEPVPAAVGEMLATRLERIRTCGFPNYFGEQRFGHGGNNLKDADALLNGKRLKRSQREICLSAARSYLFNRFLEGVVDAGTSEAPDGWLPGITRGGEMRGCDEPGFEDWYQGLARIGVKAMRRPLWVIPEAFACEIEADKLVLRFGLPTGSYATSLLREVVAYNSGVDFSEDDRDETFG